VALGLLLVGGEAEAGLPDAAKRFEGTFRATEGEDAIRQRIDAAIDAAIDSMSFVARPFARSRLRDATRPCARIRIALQADLVQVQCDDRKPTVSPPDGTAVHWTNADGNDVLLSQKVEDRAILQVVATEKGRREIAYRLSEDGAELEVDVRISSARLPAPVRYTSRFKR
jgi:hypothetical protein